MTDRAFGRGGVRRRGHGNSKYDWFVGGFVSVGVLLLVAAWLAWGPESGPAMGPLAFGIVGLAALGDSGGAIEQLTAKVEQFRAGEPVDFSTDRDDELGELYEAVGELADSVRDCETERVAAERTWQRLHAITTDTDLDEDEKVDRLLELGRDRLGVERAVVVRVDGDGDYEVTDTVGEPVVSTEAVADPSTTLPERTLSAGAAVTLRDVENETAEDAAVGDVGCYAGTALRVGGESDGVLCFADDAPREESFSGAEAAFVERLGEFVASVLERRAERASLEHAESLLDSLFTELPVHLYVKDDEARNVRMSTRFFEEFGQREMSDFLGKTDLDVLPADVAEETYADDVQVIEEGEPVIDKVERHSGEWFLTSKVPWRGADGEIRGLIGITQEITGRKERERKLEAIVQNTNNPIFIKDRDGVYQFANEAAATPLGYDVEEVLGKTDADLFDAESVSAIRTGDEQVLETGQNVTRETPLTVDGEERVFLDNKYPYRDDDGEIIGVMGISQDITEHKEREQELERTSEMLTQSQQLAQVGAWEVALEDGRPVDVTWTDELYRIHGRPLDEEIELGESLEYFHPEDRADVTHVAGRSVREGRPYEVEARIVTEDGEVRWVRSIGDPVERDGEVVCVRGSMQDVTERKEREQQIQETNERLNAIIESSPDAIVQLDRDRRVELWNPAAERTFGWSEDEVVGEELPIVPEDWETQHEDFRERVLDGETVRGVEVVRETKDGEGIEVSLSAAPLRDESGTIVGDIAVIEDITERKESERELARTSEMLEQSQRLARVGAWAIEVRDGEAVDMTWTEEVYRIHDLPAGTDVQLEDGIEFYHPDDRAEVERAVERAIEAGEAYEFEARIVTADGEQRWVRSIGDPVERDGEVVRIRGSVQDVTERREAQNQLEERERRLERYREYTDDILDAIDDVFYVVGQDLTLQRWNQSLADVTGYSDEELDDIHPSDLVVDEDEAVIGESIQEVFESGVARAEARVHTKDGDTVPYEFSGSALEDPDGNPVLVGLGRDISERKEREAELERQATMLDSLFEQIPVSLYVKDEEGRHVRTSTAYHDDNEYPDDEAWYIGKTDYEIYSEEFGRKTHADDMAVVESGEAVLEKEEYNPDDDEWLLTTKVPWRDEDGAIRGLIGITQHINNQKARQAELRETRDRLEANNRTLQRLYAITADSDRSFDEKVKQVLTLCRERLGTDAGFLAKVDRDCDHFEVLYASGDDDRIYPGATAPLSETYCRKAIDSDGLLSVVDAEDEGWADDVAYDRWDYDCYVGAKVTVADDLYGTFCFVDTEACGTAFTEEERTFVELASQWIGYELERRQREERLERYHEYTDDILDAIDDVFYVLGEDGYPKRWNETFTDAIGYSDEEMPRLHRSEIFGEGDAAAIGDAIVEAFETGSVRMEAALQTAAGEAVPYEWMGVSLEDPDGNPVVAGVGRDISERKERERQLRQTKERMQKFIETSPVGVLATDPDGAVTLWNDAMEEIFGWSEAEVLGESYPAVPEDVDTDDESIRERVLTGEPVTQVELVRETKDGERIDITLSTNPLYDETGDIVEIVGYVQDVTERKRRERELEARSAAIDGSIDGVGILNDDAEYTYVNQAHADVYGHDDPEAFLGESWTMCYDAEEVDRLEGEAIQALQSTGSWRGEAVGTRRDGTTFPQELSLSTLSDGRMVCIVRDITDRKERERELRRTTEMLEQAQRVARVGGWGLDLRGDSPEMTWTDELYGLHDIPPGTDLNIETILECYHPSDRQRIEDLFDHAVATGEGYDMEARLRTSTDQTRWVRAIGEAVEEDGEVVRLHGSIQDITAQKEREQALRSLHETTRGLLGAETESEVADIVVEAAADVLDTGGIGLYLLDDVSNQLEPTAYTDGFAELCEGTPSIGAGDADSLLWNCFVTGTPTVFDDTDTLSHSQLFGPDVGGGLLFPLGDHGVFVVATSVTTVDAGTRQLAETLVATTETALDRLESEASLRERDAELEARNRRLQRQVQITDIIRGIDRSLIRASSREEIEDAVCRQLVEAEDIAFAWIGTTDAAGDVLEPSAWAGTGDEYLDAVSLATDADAPEPAVTTATSEQPTVVSNVVDDMKREPWRKSALAADFHSALSVPLTYEGYFYGVLTVYADEPDVFGDLERSVFAELGTSIANSINAVETRRALHADTLVELSLRLDSDDTFLGRIASEVDCTVEYEGLASYTDEESRLFFAVTGGDTDRIESVLSDLVAVRDYRLVGDAEDRLLYEVTVAGEVLPVRLVRHGASPRTIRVTASETEVIVDIPTSTDVREFVGMLQELTPSIELTGKRTVERATQTRQELVSTLFDTLTDRQLEVLRTAYFAGFFEWPRTSTGEDVAEMLDVTQPTVNRHLRLAQQRLLKELLDESTPAVAAD